MVPRRWRDKTLKSVLRPNDYAKRHAAEEDPARENRVGRDRTMIKGWMTRSPLAAESAIREAVSSTVMAAVNACEELSGDNPAERRFWGDVIINRILRGVLWTILNGNAPGRNLDRPGGDRSLECSLSSKWLDRDNIVYIS